MKQTLTVILSVLSAITLGISIIEPNAELWNIKPEWITIASTIALAIKQFIEQSGLLTAEQAAQFANHEKDSGTYANMNTQSTAEDVLNWKSNK